MAQLSWQEKWTLRFAVVGLLFLALSGFEGLLMRTQQYDIDALKPMEGVLNAVRLGTEPTQEELFYSMMTAHPIVGIYGFVYMAIMGAFYYLVPFLLKREVRHKRLEVANFFLQPIGVMICWSAGFFGMFHSLYTLYWPLPVAFDRGMPVISTIAFSVGAAIIMVNILLFAFNLFSTVLSKGNPQSYSFWGFLRSAFGINRLLKWLGKEDKGAPNLDHNGLPVFLVAVGRGSIDTVINAFVLLTAGALILVYGLAALFKAPLDPGAVNALVYKNWYWWGLDMVADGNVLIYTAGIWYLLVPLLVGRELFGANVVKTVIMVDLLVSMGVWSHHLLGDRPQPGWMKLLSGQFVTWGEFFTMGLTIFAALMTIWLARPVKMTPPLKFVLASIFGFLMGGAAGLTQANTGLNMVFHNTQWVIALHAHTFLLTAVGSLVFAVLYTLVPMMIKKEYRFPKLVNVHLVLWLVGAITNAYAMGMAGMEGMLRRTLYAAGMWDPYVLAAMAGGILMALGLVVFLVNVIGTLGLGNVLRLFVPEKWLAKKEPAAA